MKNCGSHELFLGTVDILHLLPWLEMSVPKIIRRYVITVCFHMCRDAVINVMCWCGGVEIVFIYHATKQSSSLIFSLLHWGVPGNRKLQISDGEKWSGRYTTQTHTHSIHLFFFFLFLFFFSPIPHSLNLQPRLFIISKHIIFLSPLPS